MNQRLRRNPEVWHQINRLLMAGILIVVLIFVALTFRPEWNRRAELQRQLEEEQSKLKAEQLLEKQRLREVHLLQTDPEYVEIIARDKLGVMKEGETIFRLEQGKPAAVVPVTTPQRP